MSDSKNPHDGQMQIELPADVAQGTYANMAMITHSTSEFILDFIRIMPGVPKATVRSRVILTPEHTKRLLYALQDNIRKYEEKNGKIEMEKGTYVAPFPGVSGEA
ncbi:MAG: DUF3467 domain-containing protein [Bacteroidaceae bacterium]|jgi:hypothetical protein